MKNVTTHLVRLAIIASVFTHGTAAIGGEIFADNFDDNSIDASKWTLWGSSVTENGGTMQVLQNQTDAGGNLKSIPIPINYTKPITVTRNVRLHFSMDYFIGRTYLQFGSLPKVVISYGQMSYNYVPHRSVYGFFISRNDENPHNLYYNAANVSERVEPIWDSWFKETISYDPQTGNLTYSINDVVRTVFNVGVMPQLPSQNLVLQFDSWGWYTGYQHFFDNIQVSQDQVPGERIPPQIVYLAFGQDAPFKLRGAFNFYFEAAGTTKAATLTHQYKTEIMAAVRQMFSASGITNINITDVPTSGATTVYFSDENLNISGKALGGIDRFNERTEDKVIVYTFGDAIYDAETVAHEVGHSLGLLHVNPGTRNTSEGLIKEVMFADEVAGALPRFINAVSDHDSYNVADTLFTHNPLYHLKHYLDGYTSHQLETQGIRPGTWDLPFTDLISMRLDFGDTQRTLYNVVLLRSSDGTTSVSPLAQFDAITLAELEQKRFHLVPGTCLSLVGSSTPAGEADLVLSTGDPHIEESHFVPADGDTMAVTLQQFNATAFNVIADATTTGELVPRLPTVTNLSMLSTPGQFSITFAGDIGANFIIETSPDCNSWSECETVRAEGPTTTVLLTSPVTDTKRFWRIKRGQP